MPTTVQKSTALTMVESVFFYHYLGFNLVPLLAPTNRTSAKATGARWKNGSKNLQIEAQTEADIQRYLESPDENYNFTWGMLAISGIRSLRCFDIDKAPSLEAVRLVIKELGLPTDYQWATLSGSGRGNHVWFYCNDSDEAVCKAGFPPRDATGTTKAKYDQPALHADLFAHIELRWKEALTVLPPSIHPSGGIYTFLHGEPQEPPAWVTIDRIKAAWDAVAQPFPRTEAMHGVRTGVAPLCGSQETAYGKKVLETQLEKLRNLKPGDARYAAAFATSAYLFEWANGGQLNPDLIEDAVYDACVENGCVEKHGEKNVRDTITHAREKTEGASRTPTPRITTRFAPTHARPATTLKLGGQNYAK